ncbi:hypothetical protein CYY_008139 [Polysphondylium violaceum]|uniref:Importin N-terminal domain-containing protein n=1 Tax=Polysphondylium violaceum TaxID=133409 RepID=A0A8J4PQV5_9MYCE|nr:hypothetical protein CYY_008139 [Polysphondylium violaceum]
MTDQQNIAEIELCLRGLLEPNNDVIKQSTDKLNKILKTPISSLYLFHILQTSPYPEMKQLAAVLLRKKLVVHWVKMNNDNRLTIKNTILQLLLAEPTPLVKKAITEVIIIIARVELPIQNWNDFYTFLFKLSECQDIYVRQMQLHIIDTLFQHAASSSSKSYLANIYPQIAQVFQNAMKDEFSVRVYALKAIGSAILETPVESKVQLFIGLIPNMIETLKICIENEMESDAIAAFEVFHEFSECPFQSLLQYIPIICKFSLEVISNSNVDNAIKTSAIEFLDSVIQNKPKCISKNNLLEPLLSVFFNILTLDNETAEENDTEDNIYQGAGIALRECGQRYSSKIIYFPSLNVLKEYAVSQDENRRKAVLGIITQLSYGCSETMKDDIKTIIQFIVNGLQDPSKKVRQQACISVGRLSENLHPDIYEFTSTIFPLLLNSLTDPDDQFIIRCCFALEVFMGNLEKKYLLPILPNIIEKLGLLIQRNNIQVKEFGIASITSLAFATEESFSPFFDQTFGLIKNFLIVQDKNLLSLKAGAFDCLASLVKTVPKEKFAPFLKELFQVCYLNVEEAQTSEIVESCFSFYYSCFEHFGEDLKDFLPQVFDQVSKYATSEDGIIKHQDNANGTIQGIDNEEDEEEDDDEDALNASYSVRTGFVDQKSAAIHTLGVLATHLPVSFLPYCKLTVEKLDGLLGYFHNEVKDEALVALQSLIIPINKAYPVQTPWVKGDTTQQLPEATKVLLDFSFQTYQSIIKYDESKELVARVYGLIAQTIKTLGPATHPYINLIGLDILQAFNSTLYCQTCTADDIDGLGEDDEEEQDDEENQDWEDDESGDLHLIDMACECLIEISTVMGVKFKELFEGSLKTILKLTKKTILHSIRSYVIGSIAECIKVIGSDFSSSFDLLYPLGIRSLGDESIKVQRVGCYLLGVLISRSIVAKPDHYYQIIQSIHPIITAPDQDRYVLDNACGCIARMISTNNSLIPDQVIPIFISKLPIQSDFEEVDAVVDAILVLFTQKFAVVAPLIKPILSAFAHALSQPLMAPATIEKITHLLRNLLTQYNAEMKEVMNTLPENEKIVFQKL